MREIEKIYFQDCLIISVLRFGGQVDCLRFQCKNDAGVVHNDSGGFSRRFQLDFHWDFRVGTLESVRGRWRSERTVACGRKVFPVRGYACVDGGGDLRAISRRMAGFFRVGLRADRGVGNECGAFV